MITSILNFVQKTFINVGTSQKDLTTIKTSLGTTSLDASAIATRMPASGTIQTAPFRKNVAATIIFPIFDNTGGLVVGAADLDSEVSKDNAAFADCTNEATQIGTGIYYLSLTATEMNADRVAVITKTSTANAKTAVNIIYTSA